jgi:DNA polymerase-3 subunit beta
MDFVTSKENLLRELQLLQGVVEKKSTIPVLAGIVIEARKDRLEMLATDLEVGIRTSCEAMVARTGAVTLQARKLFDIVRYLPDAEVRIKSDEANWVNITCQKSRFRMVGLSSEDFPGVQEFDFSKGVAIDRATLIETIHKVAFAITTDDTRIQITGALMNLSGKNFRMVATDGHRLAYAFARLEKSVGETAFDVVVPRKALLTLTRIGEGETEVVLGQKENNVFFKVGRTMLSSTLNPAKFPEYEKVIPESNDKIARMDAAAFADAVRRVALVANDRSRGVKFALGKGSLEISASNPELGEASETLDVDYSGGPIEIGFNATYILDYLQALPQGQLILALKDEGTQGLLSPGRTETRDYRYVVMPMRISG